MAACYLRRPADNCSGPLGLPCLWPWRLASVPSTREPSVGNKSAWADVISPPAGAALAPVTDSYMTCMHTPLLAPQLAFPGFKLGIGSFVAPTLWSSRDSLACGSALGSPGPCLSSELHDQGKGKGRGCHFLWKSRRGTWLCPRNDVNPL